MLPTLVLGITMATVCPPVRHGVTTPVYRSDGTIAGPTPTREVQTYLSEDFKELVVVVSSANRSKPKVIKRIPLNLRFDANVNVDITSRDEGVRYEYSIANARTSIDAVIGLSLVVSPGLERNSIDVSNETGAQEWGGILGGRVIAAQSELNSDVLGIYADWYDKTMDPRRIGLAPGAQRGGFLLETKLLPGFTTVLLRGRQWQHGDEADELHIESGSYQSTRASFAVPQLTIGPMFRRTDPCYLIVNNYLLGFESLARCPNVRVRQDFLDAISMALRAPNACPVLAPMTTVKIKAATEFEAEILRSLNLVQATLTAREEKAYVK